MSKSKYFSIWMIGKIIQIGSDYVTDGDIKYQSKPAPLKKWFFSLAPSIVVSMFLTTILIYIDLFLNTNYLNNSRPAEYLLGVISSLLGFGIGVYALIFSISGKMIRDIQNAHIKINSNSEDRSSVLSINSDFAFPLIFLTITLITLTFQLVFNDAKLLKVFSFFMIFMSFSMTFKLIYSIYIFGKNIILEKYSESDNQE